MVDDRGGEGPNAFSWRCDADSEEPVSVFLAARTGLSRARVKDAMLKGAVWLKRPGEKERRLRRASARLGAGDSISFYHDAALLALAPPPPLMLEDLGRYSVWYKPAGLLAQGTRYGDHCSLLRQVELALDPRRLVLPVHRLDREVPGVTLVAHDGSAAGRLSQTLAAPDTVKGYLAEVLGDPSEAISAGEIRLPLDGREARTGFEVVERREGTALVRVRLFTGRTHQVRRHFAMTGHPVLGDPRYGEGNKRPGGIRLAACALKFTCPLGGRPRRYRLPRELEEEWMGEPGARGISQRPG